MSASATHCKNKARSFQPVTVILVVVFVLIFNNTLAAQTATPTDLRFHKFLPKVAPGQMAQGAANQGALPNGIGLAAAQQMQALQQDKMSRTPAQQKIDSNITVVAPLPPLALTTEKTFPRSSQIRMFVCACDDCFWRRADGPGLDHHHNSYHRSRD